MRQNLYFLLSFISSTVLMVASAIRIAALKTFSSPSTSVWSSTSLASFLASFKFAFALKSFAVGFSGVSYFSVGSEIADAALFLRFLSSLLFRFISGGSRTLSSYFEG